jgi:TatD family hydrolase
MGSQVVIFQWALLAATVGIILKMIEGRSSIIGKLVAGLIGLAWTLASFLVVPILAFEELGPFEALSRSAELFRHRMPGDIYQPVHKGPQQLHCKPYNYDKQQKYDKVKHRNGDTHRAVNKKGYIEPRRNLANQCLWRDKTAWRKITLKIRKILFNPNLLALWQRREKFVDTISRLAKEKKIVAIGETGLDFFRMKSSKEDQIKAFVEQIHMAKELRLPLVIHMRDSYSEVIKILDQEGGRDAGGVFHCFSGDIEVARRCLELGFFLSFAGNVTFKKSVALREALKAVPIERVLLETDSPYLAPEPMRGERNEPSFLRFTAERVAEEKGLSIEDVARVTSYNARKLFGIGGPEKPGKIAYAIRNSLYLNITNKCTNACVFCPKLTDYMVKGHFLKLGPEPSLNEIIGALPDLSPYREVVFCGFGEATLRLDVLKEVAKYLKREKKKVRLDTDGLANLVHGRNVLPELSGLIDSVSVSLNAPDDGLRGELMPATRSVGLEPDDDDLVDGAGEDLARVADAVLRVGGRIDGRIESSAWR